MSQKNPYLRNLIFIKLSLLVFLTLGSCDEKPKKDLPSTTILENAYEHYQEKSITERRFKYDEVIHLVKDRKGVFDVAEIGKSVEGKPIYQMNIGKGKTKVMLWSQMHGNESTATMALFDLFNFFEGEGDEFEDLRTLILEHLTIRFMPMLNPDGMDRWIRRNALDIDLNRDALALASPESLILKNARDQFEPEFGFNLHDQQIYYTAGETGVPAAISVLAPAYNYQTEINEVRQKAMQVIVGMNEMLQEVVPGHVGKYNDAFEPRAFGDNIQKWGTSTILIESGGYPNDPEKQYIRKLNFMMMLHALVEIAQKTYTDYSLEKYYAIPDNATRLMDLVIRDLSLSHEGHSYKVDVGIRRREADMPNGFYVNGNIDDFGDLSIFYGFEELKAEGLEVMEGRIFEEAFDQISDLDGEKTLGLLQEGCLAVRIKNTDDKVLYDLPILAMGKDGKIPFSLGLGGKPNFFLAKSGKPVYAVVNGYLVDLGAPIQKGYRMRVM